MKPGLAIIEENGMWVPGLAEPVIERRQRVGAARRPMTGSTPIRWLGRDGTKWMRQAKEAAMFYETAKNDHGLPYDPLKAIIAPRPIGWITSMSAKGEINLAPYSFFNAFSTRPPIVGYSSEGRKDSVALVEEIGEFVCNLATFELREAMNVTAGTYPRGVDEMREAGLEPAASRLVKPPRVAASPCALECKWLQTIKLADVTGRETERYLVLGQVVATYIDDRFIKDGMVDTAAMRPIARCGYSDYAVVNEVFSIVRPK